MDMLSKIFQPVSVPGKRLVQDNTWPASPALDGKVYIVNDPYGTRIVVQTVPTWENLGTLLEQQRRTLKAQDTAIKAQSGEIQRLTTLIAEKDAAHADLLGRHSYLRENHRELIRERVEGAAGKPDAPSFVDDLFTPSKKD